MCRLQEIRGNGPSSRIVDSAAWFDLGPAVDALDRLVLGAGWSLFSFDFAAGDALFLETGEACDLSAAPFSYQAQRDRATRLARVGLDNFLAIAAGLPAAPQAVVQLFSIGHCGSTLLHHVFNRARGVWCMSEPLFTFDVAMRSGAAAPERLRALLTGGYKFLGRLPGARDARTLVIKHFSQATRHIPLFQSACSKGQPVFLYRDGEGWCNSAYHFAQRMGSGIELDPARRNFVWNIISGGRPESDLAGIIDMGAAGVGFDELAAVAWVLQLRDDAQRAADELGMTPIRYNELVSHRSTMVEKIFALCGISPIEAHAALAAFGQDAHAGTKSSKEIAAADFGPENYARIRKIFAHPKLDFPGDTILPGTLMP